jgi:hypothetical protein
MVYTCDVTHPTTTTTTTTDHNQPVVQEDQGGSVDVGARVVATHDRNANIVLRRKGTEAAPCDGATVFNGEQVIVLRLSADHVLAQIRTTGADYERTVGWLRVRFLTPVQPAITPLPRGPAAAGDGPAVVAGALKPASPASPPCSPRLADTPAAKAVPPTRRKKSSFGCCAAKSAAESREQKRIAAASRRGRASRPSASNNSATDTGAFAAMGWSFGGGGGCDYSSGGGGGCDYSSGGGGGCDFSGGGGGCDFSGGGGGCDFSF